MRRKRFAALAALGVLVGALAVVAAGCGGGDDGGSSASTYVCSRLCKEEAQQR